MSSHKAQLHELYEKYATVVYRRAMAILHESTEAWDAVQTTFERLLRMGSFPSDAKPIAYLYRTATNVCLNQLRAQSMHMSALERGAAPGLVTAPEPAAEARSLLRALARTLDERELLIATLHFLDDLPQEQIVEIVGLSRKTVGRTLQRVKAAADSVLERQKEERNAS